MVGDGEPLGCRYDGRQAELGEQLRHVARFRGNGRCARRELGVVAKHVAVVLDVRAATGGIRDDRVEACTIELGMQPFDERGSERIRALLFAEMMHERAAAAFDGHDLHAAALKQTNRRGIDLGRDHGLNAAHDERDALTARRAHLRNRA